jgi:hypothetical protein
MDPLKLLSYLKVLQHIRTYICLCNRLVLVGKLIGDHLLLKDFWPCGLVFTICVI